MTILLGIPSKGRLKEATLKRFDEAGLPIRTSEDSRNYSGNIEGLDGIDIAFMSASEIARELIAGNLHLGITGEDLARESIADADAALDFLVPMGFGHADVVVAIPESWIDVDTMRDLDDVAAEFRQKHGRRLRIATKYWLLTQQFFAGHGIAVYRIVESLGATEGAPAAGMADAIVDITTTGATLKANRLKIPRDGTILHSQATLIRSRRAIASEKDQALIENLALNLAKSEKS